MPTQFTHRLLSSTEAPPTKEKVSAVFLVAFQVGKLLSIQNERGWDIPGGHIEGDEEPFEALQREVLEEAGAEVRSAVPYAILSSVSSPKVMLFFASDDISLAKFIPSADALARDLLDSKELLGRYYGDRELLTVLIEAAARKLKAR